MKPAIFISHSAKDPPAKALLAALEKKLSDLGFDVQIDRTRLQAGQCWRQELHTWMAGCHGAVVLFSKNAYEDSEWVLKEATILSWRKALDPDFELIPVLLPPVDGTWLSKGDYEPLALGEIQGVDGSNKAKAVAKVAARLAPLLATASSTPLDEVLRFLAEALRPVKATTLKAIAAKLGKPIQWDPARDTAEQFAREILHVELARVKDVMLELQPFVSADALRIVNAVAPFCIDPIVAAPVARVALRDPAAPPRDAVALNASDPDIGDLHIQRARQRLLQWVVIPVTAGGGADQAGSLLRQIREALLARPELARGRDRPAVLTGLLQAAREDGDPYFILLQKYVAPEVLRKLRDEYRDCTFVVLTGDAGTAAYEKKNSGVRLLRPPLARGAEDALIVLLLRAREIAERGQRGARPS